MKAKAKVLRRTTKEIRFATPYWCAIADNRPRFSVEDDPKKRVYDEIDAPAGPSLLRYWQWRGGVGPWKECMLPPIPTSASEEHACGLENLENIADAKHDEWRESIVRMLAWSGVSMKGTPWGDDFGE